MHRHLRWTLFAVVLLCGVATVSPASATATADTPDGNVTMYRAHDSADLESVSDIRAGIENGTIENTSGLVVNETLVVEIESDRLAAELEAENSSPTEALFDSSEAGTTGRDVVLSAKPKPPGLATFDVPLGPENTTLRRSGNATYVLVDSRSVNQRGKRVFRGDLYSYSLRLDTEAVTLDSDEPAVRFYQNEIEVSYLSDGEPLPTERIRHDVVANIGTVDDLEARLELEDGVTRTAAVEPVDGDREKGRFSFDLSDVDHGTAYTLELRRDGRSLRTMRGSVLESHARLEVQDVNATANGSRRNVSKAIRVAVELSHGGEIRVTDPTGGSVLDVEHVDPSEKRTSLLPLYNVSPSANESVHIHLEREPAALETHYPNGSPAAVIHENGSVTRYAADFETPTTDIVDSGSETENESAAGTSATDGSTEPENTVASDDESADEPPTEDDIPGFTAVATVMALFLVAQRIGRRT
ncbi:hypothetical protein [Natrinema amylolyticum]|uniref:hypothetical protein n=1 Tax=Natrinema amylolyticum TaxID=2878679 RepID=UPI001CFA8EB4|nr:hypothetical protein [Natrinema amylolyticum]